MFFSSCDEFLKIVERKNVADQLMDGKIDNFRLSLTAVAIRDTTVFWCRVSGNFLLGWFLASSLGYNLIRSKNCNMLARSSEPGHFHSIHF